MAATGITAVKDAVVALIETAWNPTAPSEVKGVGRVDEVIGETVGRKVYVFRSARTDEPGTRADDQIDYTLVIWVVERYADAGDPPEEWIDDRVAWVEWLLETLGSVRGTRLLPNADSGGLWAQGAELTTVYDVEDLTEHKAFSSVLTVTYREHAEA